MVVTGSSGATSPTGSSSCSSLIVSLMNSYGLGKQQGWPDPEELLSPKFGAAPTLAVMAILE